MVILTKEIDVKLYFTDKIQLDMITDDNRKVRSKIDPYFLYFV